MNTTAQAIIHLFDSMPIARLLQLRLEDATPEHVVVSMPVDPRVTFDGVVCQGGIVAVLADFAAVSAAASAVLDSGKFVATTAMNTHNLRPAAGERLVAVGRLVGAPGRTMIAAADVYNDSIEGERCLTGLFTATALPAPIRRPGVNAAQA